MILLSGPRLSNLGGQPCCVPNCLEFSNELTAYEQRSSDLTREQFQSDNIRKSKLQAKRCVNFHMSALQIRDDKARSYNAEAGLFPVSNKYEKGIVAGAPAIVPGANLVPAVVPDREFDP